MPKKGTVVQVTAGRNCGRYFVVLQADERRCLIADGRRRPLQRPKTKNKRHLQILSVSLTPEQYSTDGRLRQALRQIHHREDDNSPEKGG